MSFFWNGHLGSHSSHGRLGIGKKCTPDKSKRQRVAQKMGGGKKMDSRGYLYMSKYKSLCRDEGSLCYGEAILRSGVERFAAAKDEPRSGEGGFTAADQKVWS